MSNNSVQKNPRFSQPLYESIKELADEHEENPTKFIVKCITLISSLNKLQGMQDKKAKGYTTLETIKRATLEFIEE